VQDIYGEYYKILLSDIKQKPHKCRVQESQLQAEEGIKEE
jgi:hypothetical protein